MEYGRNLTEKPSCGCGQAVSPVSSVFVKGLKLESQVSAWVLSRAY